MALRAAHLAVLVGLVVLVSVGVGASGAFDSPRSVGCSAITTKALVEAFVQNYDSGQVAVIDRLWARRPYFQWFSTRAPGARLGAAAYSRSTLASYFRARVRAHENLRVIKLGAGYDPKRNIVNFVGKLVRSADDLPAGAPQDFKGAAQCGLGRALLIVWSM